MKRLTFALGLLVACGVVHKPLVAKLFQADPDKLCEYAYKGNLKKVKEAIAKGAGVNAEGKWTIRSLKRSRTYSGMSGTPLYAAAQGDRIEVAKYLLANGAQVNVPNKVGRTPLYHAAKGSLGMAQLLITNGAKVNVSDEYGFTPLHRAVRGRLDVAQLLITNGADLDAQTKGGSTPLHFAATSTKKMATLLVTSGANPYIKNRDGRYPYHITRRSGIAYRPIAKILDPESRHKKDKATRKAARKEKRREGRVEFLRKVGVRD